MVSTASFFTRTRRQQTNYAWTLSVLTSGTPAQRTHAAQTFATMMMWRLMEGVPDIFALWQRRAVGAHAPQTAGASSLAPATAAEAGRITPFIQLTFGLPSAPLPDNHAEGIVGEYLWWLHASEATNPQTPLLRIEGPDAQVTSQGGDGLTVHRDLATNQLFFRLWESKKQTSARSISATTRTAFNQLNAKAQRYLAQMSGLALKESDAEIAALMAQMVGHWADRATQASAGFSISTGARPRRAFTAAPTHFPWLAAFPHGLEGVVTSIPNYAAFVAEVRAYVWSAL